MAVIKEQQWEKGRQREIKKNGEEPYVMAMDKFIYFLYFTKLQ